MTPTDDNRGPPGVWCPAKSCAKKQRKIQQACASGGHFTLNIGFRNAALP
jgi:hypothetical protein